MYSPQRRAVLGWLLASTGPAAWAASVGASGVRFSCGPGGKPDARVFIQELGTKPTKRGFVRIAALPVASITGMEVRVLRYTSSIFREIAENVRVLIKTSEFEMVRFSLLAEPDGKPRLTAGFVNVRQTEWTLKEVQIWQERGLQRFPECTLRWNDERAELDCPNRPRIEVSSLFT